MSVDDCSNYYSTMHISGENGGRSHPPFFPGLPDKSATYICAPNVSQRAGRPLDKKSRERGRLHKKKGFLIYIKEVSLIDWELIKRLDDYKFFFSFFFPSPFLPMRLIKHAQRTGYCQACVSIV